MRTQKETPGSTLGREAGDGGKSAKGLDFYEEELLKKPFSDQCSVQSASRRGFLFIC